jgi:tetraacyldisaccharide 4'-kinase
MNPLGPGLIPSALSRLFGGAIALRNAFYDTFPGCSKQTGAPTISIGGISAGGTGKTPMTLLVAEHIHKSGRLAVFLSRGFKRKNKKIVVSPPGTFDAWENVGDEPAMLHAALPQAWLGVGGNRHAVQTFLAPRLPGNSVYILDDGFQHRQLKRDVDILCLSSDTINDRLLPSGSLREPVRGLNRAHCVCLIGSGEEAASLHDARQKIQQKFPLVPVFILFQIPCGWTNLSTNEFKTQLPIKLPAAVCGIARPQRFFFLLKKLSIFTSAESIFSDHHVFKEHEIDSIVATPGLSGIVTTEKDAFRLKSLKLAGKENIWYLKVKLQFSDNESENKFYRLIDKAIL